MANDMTLLGALVATKNLTYDDAKLMETFCEFVDEVNVDVPDLSAAIDLALDFFADDPDVEAARESERIQALHDENTCPDCGGPMLDGALDDYDVEQAINLWSAVRDVADKYAFDQMHSHHGPDVEEC